MKRDFPACSSCGGPRDRHPQRYCRACHAKYMREHRPIHSALPDEARRKANCRAYANVYQRRGKLVKRPCEECGSQDSQKHHDDYEKPLQVTWLCRPCHLAEHRGGKVRRETLTVSA
jgi:hypothetical protein